MKLLVTDALWERLQPLLPPPPPRRFRFPGRKPLDYRKILTGILFVLKTGIAWDDLPAELGCGCGKTCRHYLQLWHQAGVWRQLHALLLAELNGADQIDWKRALIDASFAKAPEGGEDTGPNPTDRGKSGSKHHLMTDAHPRVDERSGPPAADHFLADRLEGERAEPRRRRVAVQLPQDADRLLVLADLLSRRPVVAAVVGLGVAPEGDDELIDRERRRR